MKRRHRTAHRLIWLVLTPLLGLLLWFILFRPTPEPLNADLPEVSMTEDSAHVA